MPEAKTADDPKPEPLDLRLLRDVLDEHAVPLTCRRRQCRRNRHCSGEAQRADRPLASGAGLPPCAAKAKPEAHPLLQTMLGDIEPHVGSSTEPRQWPEDTKAAAQLRLALAMLHRIHTRPGPHPQSERTALAAWQATDPDPHTTTLYRLAWHHSKPEKPNVASPGTAP
ncbi:MAG: hypothetical protein ACT6RF_16465 [Allorhizobium sp.]|uniref:hypothetical protein n=1 Tax=Allorhizobium sp. TaxID=633478 RepID=UPI004033F82C